MGDFWLKTRAIIKISTQEYLTNLYWDEEKKFQKNSKMADSKKLSFSKTPILKTNLQKFHGLVLGSVELIDEKGIDVAQPIWP